LQCIIQGWKSTTAYWKIEFVNTAEFLLLGGPKIVRPFIFSQEHAKTSRKCACEAKSVIADHSLAKAFRFRRGKRSLKFTVIFEENLAGSCLFSLFQRLNDRVMYIVKFS